MTGYMNFWFFCLLNLLNPGLESFYFWISHPKHDIDPQNDQKHGKQLEAYKACKLLVENIK